MHNRRFLTFLVCLSVLMSTFCSCGATLTARLVRLAYSDQKTIYPNEDQFSLILSWINERIKSGADQTFFPSGWQLHLNEFTNYKYGLSQHSFVSVTAGGQDNKYGYHMKLFITDYLHDGSRVLFVFDNGGSLMKDSLVACYLVKQQSIAEFKELVSLFENLKTPFIDSLDNPPFSIEEGRVEMNFIGYSAVDRHGHATNPYSYGARILKTVKTHLTWASGVLNSRVEELLD